MATTQSTLCVRHAGRQRLARQPHRRGRPVRRHRPADGDNAQIARRRQAPGSHTRSPSPCGVASPAGAPKTSSGLGCTYGPRLRPRLAEQFVRHLAELHRFAWSSYELAAFDRPQAGTTEAVDWRLAACDQAWADDAFEPHPTMILTREWLWAHRPVVDHVSPVHGDYRNGNFLFDEERAQITAILDWELTYLGDRHHDLAYAMTPGWGERDAETGEFYCSALVTREQLIEDYERISGLPVDPAPRAWRSMSGSTTADESDVRSSTSAASQ
ncbi:MAG: phosphotransferase family protein [Solirubrobacteraceae bacterium]